MQGGHGTIMKSHNFSERRKEKTLYGQVGKKHLPGREDDTAVGVSRCTCFVPRGVQRQIQLQGRDENARLTPSKTSGEHTGAQDRHPCDSVGEACSEPPWDFLTTQMTRVARPAVTPMTSAHRPEAGQG